jgi:hypothetical protein
VNNLPRKRRREGAANRRRKRRGGKVDLSMVEGSNRANGFFIYV